MTVLLVVLDGFGLNDDPSRNALLSASMWNWNRMLAEWPHARLEASGEAVGLPAGQMGNSEVGHLNLGAGFRVLQDLPRISAAIADARSRERGLNAAGADLARALACTEGAVGPGGVHAARDNVARSSCRAPRLPPDRSSSILHDGFATRRRAPQAFLAEPSPLFGVRQRRSGRPNWAMDRDVFGTVRRGSTTRSYGLGSGAQRGGGLAGAYARDEGTSSSSPRWSASRQWPGYAAIP